MRYKCGIRELTVQSYLAAMHRWLHRNPRCKHWNLRKPRMKGQVTHDYKHRGSKVLWVEVV